MRKLSNKDIQKAVTGAWDSDSALTNMERWLAICERENLGDCPENIGLLTSLFGASWYFTRFVFYLGSDIIDAFDHTREFDLSRNEMKSQLQECTTTAGDLEQQFEQLRVRKNYLMLRLFLGKLTGELSQEQQELGLTNLAEVTLQTALVLLSQGGGQPYAEYGVLAMGRMAGHEMNFGSDLDLIFLYDYKSGDDQHNLIRKIESLLRHIAAPSVHGILYEIDMRLRPHGTSGTLISASNYFIEYHQAEREIWERQMMTRCRPVLDSSGLAEKSLAAVMPAIYERHDRKYLGQEISGMRHRVEKELGNPAGKFEIKRGAGGIMDIDFICHYLQLTHGHKHPELQTASTRKALNLLGKSGFVDTKAVKDLTGAYDFLKKIEGILRIADLKNISSFSRNPEDNIRLSRAMGYLNESQLQAAEQFLENYQDVTGMVRGHFDNIVGGPA